MAKKPEPSAQMKRSLYPNFVAERVASFKEVGNILLKKIPETLGSKLLENKLDCQYSIMEEIATKVDNLTLLALTVLISNCGYSIDNFETENFLDLFEKCVKPSPSNPLLSPVENFEYFCPDVKMEKLNNLDFVIELENQWHDMILSDYFNFDIRPIDGSQCKHGHWWHGYCPSNSVEMYRCMPAIGHTKVANKFELLNSLICVHHCQQVCNIWDRIEPVSRLTRRNASPGCGGWYEMNKPGAAKYGRAMFNALQEEKKKLMGCVCCEKCKMPGCVGLILCTSTLENYPKFKNGELPVDGLLKEMYSVICAADPSLQEKLEKLGILYPTKFYKYFGQIITFGWTTYKYFGQVAYEIILRVISDPEGYNIFSSLIKQAGLHSTAIGSILCDLDKFKGKLFKSTDPKLIIEKILTKLTKKMNNLNSSILRDSIRMILSRELPTNVEIEGFESFWTKRWEWAADHEDIVIINPESQKKTAHLEELTDNPLTNWDGISYAYVDLDKNLKIDGITNMCYEYLVSKVEKEWLNSKIVLKVESAGGLIGIYKKLRDLKSGEQYYLSLEIDDSTILTNHQALVIEELCNLLKMPEELKRKFSANMKNIQVLNESGKSCGKLEHSIIKNHRASKIVTSIILLAYLETLRPGIKLLIHDDNICCVFDSPDEALSLVATLNDIISVQSRLSRISTDFLGCTFTSKSARACLWNSISTILENLTKFNDNGIFFIKEIISNSWSLINRSGNPNSIDIFLPTFQRLTGFPLDICRKLLRGKASLGFGPVRKSKRDQDCLELIYLNYKDVVPKFTFTNLSSNATNDYLCNVYSVSEQEKLALKTLNLTPNQVLLHQSYKNILKSDFSIQISKYLIKNQECRNVDDLIGVIGDFGKLSGFKILRLLKSKISTNQLKEIFTVLGIDETNDLESSAWGSEAKCTLIDGVLPFKEAERVSRSTNNEIILVKAPLFI